MYRRVGRFDVRGMGMMFWHRVESARMPRMAFAQSASGQHRTTQRAVFMDRFLCVIGAAWIETAILAQQRTDAQFVGAQQNQKQAFHRTGSECCRSALLSKCLSSAASVVLHDDEEALCWRVTTGADKRMMQSMPGSADVRKLSLARRLIMFRVTALCASRFATTTPSLA